MLSQIKDVPVILEKVIYPRMYILYGLSIGYIFKIQYATCTSKHWEILYAWQICLNTGSRINKCLPKKNKINTSIFINSFGPEVVKYLCCQSPKQ